MIFPEYCKYVGYASHRPVGEKVYFLSRYLLKESGDSFEVLEVTLAEGTDMMRDVVSVRLIATPDEVTMHPERVILHNRGDLIQRASESKTRCTIFTGIDEHMTFICDPDLSALLTVHVYDVTPPRPHLADTLRALEATGIFGELQIAFVYHINDIRTIGADVYPCRAGGFSRTIDTDLLTGGEQVAGCMTARQILAECYGSDFPVIDICPANAVTHEPFIARCCRSERTGIQKIQGKTGIVVHWGDAPKQFCDAVYDLVAAFRKEREKMHNQIDLEPGM